MRPRVNAAICIFLLTMVLTAVGMWTVYSTSSAVAGPRQSRIRMRQLNVEKVYQPQTYDALYLKKQLIWFAGGLALLLLFYSTDYSEILNKHRWLAFLSIALVLSVYIPGLGHRVQGALRWIRIGPFTLQPSEFAKLLLVMVTAKMLSDREATIRSFTHGFLAPLLLAILVTGIVAKEDLGSAIVFGMILLPIWFIAGVRILHMAALLPPAAGAAALLCYLQDWRWKRVTDWLNGQGPPDAWQQPDMALMAVGTGGWTGLGLGMGIQKHYWVAAMHTDFIFADLCEELGFIGGASTLVLFVALLLIGFRVAYKSPDLLGSLLAGGLTMMIAVPVLVNVAVVLQVIPTTGLALPFISYGGSSLVTSLAAVGLLMNIARKNEETQTVRRRPVAVTRGFLSFAFRRPRRV